MAISNQSGVKSRQIVATSCLLAYILVLTPLLCQAKRVDVPTVDNFIRRWQCVAAVIGDYVYIDGGELTQFEDGSIDDGVLYQVNSTLSINLSTSWTTSNVSFRTIQKPNTPKNTPVIWIDKVDKGGFYSWAGSFSVGRGLADPEMWKFSADGQGGGSWSLYQDFANPEGFRKLRSPQMGPFVNTEDKGFLIGGYIDSITQVQYIPGYQIIPGMVMFDMRTKQISNGTTADEGPNHSPFETLVGGKANFIPPLAGTTNDRGLILVLGGYRSYVDRVVPMANAPGFDLRNITFFDPVTRETYWQTTTGDIPPSPRSMFCVTGFAAAGGGYDVFIFGGYHEEQRKVYDDAYILSFPGFVWTKVSTSPAGPRYLHACVSVGSQVLSIGGVSSSTNLLSVDTAAQGLLLFDMTTQSWENTYDFKAKDYQRAKILKDWYQDGGLEKVEWSSDRVKTLFVKDGGVKQAEPGDAPQNLTTTQTSAGAAAGAAFGATAGSAILVALGLWLFHRHETAKKQKVKLNDMQGWASLTHLAEVDKIKTPVDRIEADTSHGYWELPSMPENTFHHSARTTIDRVEVGVGYSP